MPCILCLVLAVPSLRGADQEPASREAKAIATGFLYKTVTMDKETYPYCVYVPPEYVADRAWPVILFLHGSGERGEDGFLQTDVGIGRALRHHRQMIPAIVVMPQCRRGQLWVGPMADMALKCVEQTSREYHLDGQRVYLTGISMGGHGVWHLAAARPHRFAALVPICGFADLREDPALERQLAARLTRIPIRCYHGALDTNVPPARSRAMVNTIRELGGRIEYTEYPGADHFIWDRAYEDPLLWRWVFAQALETPASTAPAAP